MSRVLVLILLLLIPAAVHAAHFAGIALDTSSNMLLRPEGESGTLTSLYGGIEESVGAAVVSYNGTAGFIEQYQGIQYHRHNFDIGYPLMQNAQGLWTIAGEGTIARYGEVTILEGYQQFGGATTVKYYLTPRTLLRWEAGGSHRTYRSFDTENYSEFETYLRLDRFFASGLTLRLQGDGGMRQYRIDGDTPRAYMAGIRFRAAKSLGPRWGVWAETYFTDVTPAESPADTTSLYDRVFLDDPYKYSKYGLVFNVKHLFVTPGSVELRTSVLVRHYDDKLDKAYWYLPHGGWDEREFSAYLSISYLPRWFPALVMPSLNVYYIDVAASESFLSYESVGMTISFDY